MFVISTSEDCLVKVWQIPDGGLTKNMTEPIVDLLKHQVWTQMLVVTVHFYYSKAWLETTFPPPPVPGHLLLLLENFIII